MTSEQIKSAALQLEPAEREALAEELLMSIAEEDRASVEASWLAEAKRRDLALSRGETTVKPVDEVIARLTRRALS